MSIGQLPRLWDLTKEGIRDWSDKTMQRLEFIFTSPRQFGLAEIEQFQSTAAGTGYLTVPTPVGDLLIQWGNDVVDPPPVGPASPVIAPGMADLAIAGEIPSVAGEATVLIVPTAGTLPATGSAPLVTTAVPVPAGRRDVTFPFSFPNSCFVAFAIGSGTNAFPYSVSNLSATGFTANVANAGIVDSFYWIAIGN